MKRPTPISRTLAYYTQPLGVLHQALRRHIAYYSVGRRATISRGYFFALAGRMAPGPHTLALVERHNSLYAEQRGQDHAPAHLTLGLLIDVCEELMEEAAIAYPNADSPDDRLRALAG